LTDSEEQAVGSNDSDLPEYTDVKMPKNFDSREKWPQCESIGTVRDQGPCGGCWAVAVVQVLNDRWCIQTEGKKTNPLLSYTEVLSCSGGGGCHGGQESGAWNYARSSGVGTGGLYDDDGKKTCQPDIFERCCHHQFGEFPLCPPSSETETPQCKTECFGDDVTDENKDFRVFADRSYWLRGEDQIKRDMYHYGPVSVTFGVHADFYFYNMGIYQKTSGEFIGNHAVKLIGWGEEEMEFPTGDKETVPYWIILNTWNPQWGEGGQVRFLRRDNHQGIARTALAGFADVERTLNYNHEVDVGHSFFQNLKQNIVVKTLGHLDLSVIFICIFTSIVIFYIALKPTKDPEYMPIDDGI